jgi:hypothetical protein
MVKEGMATEAEMRATDQEDLEDIRSAERLRLIFDTNVRQAYGFGNWKQGQTPAALRAFPAARLIRERDVMEPRPRHAAHLGEVRLKNDPWWADYINAEEIGGFGVPWGPYGFRSGCNQEDVPRSEAKALGLAVNSVLPDRKELNDGLKASTKGMDPAVKARLRESLARSRASRKGNATPEEAAREAAARARQRAAQRKGGPEFRDGGDEVRLVYGDVLDSAGRAGIVPSDEPMAGIPSDPERAGEDSGSVGRRAALAVRAASQDVLPQWTTPKGGGTPGDVSDRSIEAQIAAAVEGRKPLYYEPWGDKELSDQLAASYRNVLSEAVNIRSRNGTIYVYRDEAVSPILDDDPAFYRPNGEDDFEAIVRVSERSENGELLGYGARSIMERPGHEVRIFKGERLLLYYFVSSPDRAKAMKFANDRSVDFIRAFGWDDVRYELARVE